MFSVSCAVVVKKNQKPKKFTKLESHGHFIEVFFLPLNKEESEEFEQFKMGN